MFQRVRIHRRRTFNCEPAVTDDQVGIGSPRPSFRPMLSSACSMHPDDSRQPRCACNAGEYGIRPCGMKNEGFAHFIGKQLTEFMPRTKHAEGPADSDGSD